MSKAVFYAGSIFMLIGGIMIIAGVYKIKHASTSFEPGETLLIYGFLTLVAAAAVTLIAKIIVSQRG